MSAKLANTNWGGAMLDRESDAKKEAGKCHGRQVHFKPAGPGDC